MNRHGLKQTNCRQLHHSSVHIAEKRCISRTGAVQKAENTGLQNGAYIGSARGAENL